MLPLDTHVLGLGKEPQGLVASLAPDARVLHPAQGVRRSWTSQALTQTTRSRAIARSGGRAAAPGSRVRRRARAPWCWPVPAPRPPYRRAGGSDRTEDLLAVRAASSFVCSGPMSIRCSHYGSSPPMTLSDAAADNFAPMLPIDPFPCLGSYLLAAPTGSARNKAATPDRSPQRGSLAVGDQGVRCPSYAVSVQSPDDEPDCIS